MELCKDSENLGNSKHMKLSEEKGEGGCAQMGKMGPCATWCLAPISSCPYCCCWGWSTSFPQDSHFETNHTVPRSEKNSIQLILRSVLGSKSTFLYNCQWHRNWSLQLFFLFLFRLPRSNCIVATTTLGICFKLCNVICCIHTELCQITKIIKRFQKTFTFISSLFSL